MKKSGILFITVIVAMLLIGVSQAREFLVPGDQNYQDIYSILNLKNITGNFTIDGNINMTGKNITNVNAIFGDNNSVRIGDAASSDRGMDAEDDLMVTGKLEVDGTSYFDTVLFAYGGISLPGTISVDFGGSPTSYGGIRIDTAKDQLLFGVGSDLGTQFIFTEKVNWAKDHDHVDQANPTLFIHSATNPDDDNTEWMSLTYKNETDRGEIDVGKGEIAILDNLNLTGKNITGVDSIIGLGDNIRIGDAGTDTHSLTSNDDLFVSGNFEVDGTAYFDNAVTFALGTSFYGPLKVIDNIQIRWGNDADVQFEWDETADQFLIDLGVQNQMILTNNLDADQDHPAQANPTILIHSSTNPDINNTQWGSLTHDTVDTVLDSGTGSIVLDDSTRVAGDITSGDSIGNEVADFYDDGTYFRINTIHDVIFNNGLVIGGNINISGNNITNVNTIFGAGDYLRIGDVAFTSHSLDAEDDLMVSGELEVDGVSYFDGRLTIAIAAGFPILDLKSGAFTYLSILNYIDDGTHFGIDSTDGGANNNLILTSAANKAKNHSHSALSTNPTLFIHSITDPDDDNTEWLSFTYKNKTDRAEIDVGKGELAILDNLNMTGRNITGLDSIIGLGDNVRIGDAGTDSQSLVADDDLFISGKLEVDGTAYFDSYAKFATYTSIADDRYHRFGNSDDSSLGWATMQVTENTMMFALGSTANSIIFTTTGNKNIDHDHSAQTDPTIFIHSVTNESVDATEWLSLTYSNASNRGEINVGKGEVAVLDNINMTGKNITNVDYINSEGTLLNVGGSVYLDEALIVDENVTAENVWLPTYCFAHTIDAQNITSGGTWLNVSFDEGGSLCAHMTHDYTSNTLNNTFIIQDDGVYDITYHMTFSDTAASPTGHIEVRVVMNSTELAGSLLEEDSSKQYNDFTIGNGGIFKLTKDDELKFQFTADDTTVGMSSHAQYGDHKDTSVIKIRRIA